MAENELELNLKGEDIGFANYVASKLMENKGVTFAAAKEDYGLEKKTVLLIRTRTSDPKKELAKALKEIRKEADEFSKQLK